MKTSVIFSALLLAVSLNANATNSTEKPLKGYEERNNSRLFAVLETVKEEAANIEAWMLDAESFAEKDEFREVEAWMLDPLTFTKPETANAAVALNHYFTDEYEEAFLEIEPWMLSEESYGLDYFEADYEEAFLPIEGWMFNF